jgi:hypothetical protein
MLSRGKGLRVPRFTTSQLVEFHQHIDIAGHSGISTHNGTEHRGV